MQTNNPPTRIQKFNDWMSIIKNGMVALASVFGIGVTGVGVYNGVSLDEISVEEIKVPSAFDEQGYKSDTTTIRILDEIKKFQDSTGSAKERVSFFGTSNQQLQTSNLQLAGTGVDVKAIQTYIRDSLGMVTAKVGGEITARKESDVIEYHIKIRKTPENHILVDERVRGSVEDVIHRTSIKLLETTDPHIAAATYWSRGDEANSLRLIDVVLSNSDPNDDKYSLNLRAYIHITNKRLEEAQRDIDQLSQIAPDFVPLLSSKGWIAREKGDFSESLSLSDEQIRRAPNKWWGYLSRAQSLQGLKQSDQAEKSYLKALSLHPEVPGPYLTIGRFFLAKSDIPQATEALRTGASKFKHHPMLNLTYADVLKQQKMFVYAESIYRQFLNDPKFKAYALIGISESLAVQQKAEELKTYKEALRQHIKVFPLNTNDTKLLGKRLDVLLS
jgi:tetratricopeptide (TPR) repeat protein